ncbi:MBL fold metallo-hydrolase [Shimia sp. R11_0]|uniref:MBL fold metallo-hydrolase n=1 Tax=Shimia sp. R11_0 TaxID=2821096 RepID=UPI001ADB0EEE|nr:MBL fold metallo-hydrolase [Shimia sp. R11_0]MBO9477018.1 MBL fold metallo-hydrolase [Shimia sp. R11_0]
MDAHILAFNPEPGKAEQLAPNLRRILAPNPSPMTFRGTNTYLIGDTELAVIDPGPDHPDHLKAILAAVTPEQTITHIIVTHAHLDHSPLARALSDETGAPVYAYGDPDAGRSAVMQALADSGLAGGGEGVDLDFMPDRVVCEGEVLRGRGWALEVIHTPGHFGNHISLAMEDVCFCGDHVMGWASSLVSPPDGDLTDFMASCEKLSARQWRVFHAGHGAPIENPSERLAWLMAHRKGRESEILAGLTSGSTTAEALASAIYKETPAALLPAATRNVFAHLVDLHGKKRVSVRDQLAADAVFELL